MSKNEMKKGMKQISKFDDKGKREEMDIDDEKERKEDIPIIYRLTSRFLTKYERARIIGERAIQLSNNSLAMVEVEKGLCDSLKIAEKELNERKIPFTIRRYLPNGDYEDWNVNDLIFD